MGQEVSNATDSRAAVSGHNPQELHQGNHSPLYNMWASTPNDKYCYPWMEPGGPKRQPNHKIDWPFTCLKSMLMMWILSKVHNKRSLSSRCILQHPALSHCQCKSHTQNVVSISLLSQDVITLKAILWHRVWWTSCSPFPDHFWTSEIWKLSNTTNHTKNRSGR